MKCELTIEGILIIESESDIEEYALRRWKEKNEYDTYFTDVIKIKKRR
ncbi:hypothetical protein GQ472_01910 [archaeon]|nr:hypothetical protein [archaeon]